MTKRSGASEEKEVSRMEQRTDGVVVTARWTVGTDRHISKGPSEVTVTLDPAASPRTRQRGVTTGVLRRVEEIVLNMTEENGGLAKRAQSLAADSFSALVKERVEALPGKGPRSATGDYYGDLLALFEMIEATEPNPLAVLATAMDVPLGTVRSRVRKAKMLRDERDG